MTPCVIIENIHKVFKTGIFAKKSHVLNGVNLQIDEGEVLGFLGPNGSGKTTTIKLMLGLIFPTKGKIQIFGKNVTQVQIKKDIGYLPDLPYFYSYLSGEEFLNFYAQLLGIDRHERRKRVDYLLDLVDIEYARKMHLRKYSRGMLQRIGMAQALINNPRLVIMDEPQTGLDPVGRKKIRDIILQLKKEGKTVFFSSHILSDVEMICDRVAILVKGQVKGVGSLSNLLQAKTKSVEICIKALSDEPLVFLREKYGDISRRGDFVYVNVKEEIVQPLLQDLVSKKINLISVLPHRESLEDLFMSEIR